ncbi:MAG: hypothetical protein GX670_10800, partial [Bacteroidales bacterium]|nr:hypothetical protein [Bacteroidales bacterium]
MKEEKAIVIDNFQRGVAENEFLGHSVMSGFSLDKTGILKKGRSLSSSSLSGHIDDGEYIVIEDSGLIVTTTTSGDKNYLYSSTAKLTSYGNSNYGPGDVELYHNKYYISCSGGYGAEFDPSTDTFDNTKFGIASNQFTNLLTAKDDIMYVFSGRYVSSYDGTLFSANICTLPTNVINTVAVIEYGDIILMASTTNKGITIFSWDRQSNFADIWAEIQDTGLIGMKQVNNVVYILCSGYGNLYASNGSQVKRILSFGSYIRNTRAKRSNNIFAGVGFGLQNTKKNIFQSFENKLLFGPFLNNFSGNSRTYPLGVYSYDIDTGVVSQEFSDDEVFSLTQYDFGGITCISVPDASTSSLRVSYYKENVSNSSLNSRKYYSYQTYANPTGSAIDGNQLGMYESQMFNVGNTTKKKTFNRLKIQLNKEIIGSISVYYRTSSIADWT